MNAARLFIAGDWGTSHLRLFLCEGTRILERREGPGIARLTVPSGEGPQGSSAAQSSSAPFASIITDLTRPWTHGHGALPLWLCGMVGSRAGWRETQYLTCPVDTAGLRASTLRFTEGPLDVAIVPGLTSNNPRGAPDVLRGEETQIVGALRLRPELNHGRQVLVLPGTHTKWVLLEQGGIIAFQTSFSGELYELLATRSTLAHALKRGSTTAGSHGASDDVPNETAPDSKLAFQAGAKRATLDAPLGHLLFEVRSRQLIDGLPHQEALAFLSGLIIAQDVRGALGLFGDVPGRGQRVTLIGATELLHLYRQVLTDEGLDTLLIDAAEATLSGLTALAAAS